MGERRKGKMKKSFTFYVFWLVFLGLLATMLPHTQWAFRQLEPATSAAIIAGWGMTWAEFVSWAAAFSFEAGLAVFVHRLSRKIEATRKVYKGVGEGRTLDTWGTIAAKYINIFTAGVLFCAFVSGMANYFHALEFSVPLAAFSKVVFFKELYPLALGAALPVVSLIFASALSNVSEDEAEDDPANVELKNKNSELNKQNRELSQQFSKLQATFSELQAKFSDVSQALKNALARVSDREQELNTVTEKLNTAKEQVNSMERELNMLGGEVKYLFSEDSRERILYIKRTWNELPNTSIAIMAGVSPGRVSQVLKDAPIPVSLSVNVDAE
jgi:uncharacterized membrane-anchored protein YhcB (DUF1043 family)